MARGEGAAVAEGHVLAQIADCLRTSLAVFTGAVPGTHRDPTVGEVCALLGQALGGLLAADPAPRPLRAALFDAPGGLLAVVLEVLGADLLFAPGLRDAAAVEAAFADLRVSALQALMRVVALCSNDHRVGPDDPERQLHADLAQECSDAMAKERGVETLFRLLQSPGPEALKVAAVECLFVFLVRNAAGRAAAAAGGAVPELLALLQAEPCPAVRNYLCALVREFAKAHYGELVQHDCSSLMLGLMRTDPSPDVRTLATETLDCIFKGVPSALLTFPLKEDLVDVLALRLQNERSAEVMNAVLRLLQTIFVAESGGDQAPADGGAPLLSLFCSMDCHMDLLGHVTAHPQTVLLRHLGSANIEYYGDIPIWDCTGECLNHAAAHAAVQPEPSAFPAIFHAQEARLEDGDGGGQALGLPQGRFTLPDAGQWDKQARITYGILCYSIHLGLSDPAGDESGPIAAALPPPPQGRSPLPSTGPTTPQLPAAAPRGGVEIGTYPAVPLFPRTPPPASHGAAAAPQEAEGGAPQDNPLKSPRGWKHLTAAGRQLPPEIGRHVKHIHKLLLTTPQTARTRRCFLTDMLHTILPKVQDAVAAIIDKAKTFGQDRLQQAVLTVRRGAMARGEARMDCGNVMEVADQLNAHFRNEIHSAPQSPAHSKWSQEVDEKLQQLQRQAARIGL